MSWKHRLELWLTLIVVGVIAVYAWERASTKFDSKPATEAPAVSNVPKKPLKLAAPAVVYDKPAKARLRLPPAVQANDDVQVTSATEVAPDDHKQTVTSTIDAKTGETKTYVKKEPYPWLSIEPRGEVRAAYGLKYSVTHRETSNVGRLMFNYDVVRVKAFTAGVGAHMDTDGDTFVGVGIGYRF